MRVVLVVVATSCLSWASAQNTARPKTGDAWRDMDYGPFLTTTSSTAQSKRDIVAYKGFHVRLGPQHYAGQDLAMVFDSDLMGYGAGWTGDFLNLIGVSYEGSHGTHSSLNGEILFRNSLKPGWAKEGSFEDPRELPWGPIPRDWAHYKGLYVHEDRVIFRYTVGETMVYDMPYATTGGAGAVLTRTLNLSAHEEPMLMQVMACWGRRVSEVDKSTFSAAASATKDRLPVLLLRRPASKKAGHEVIAVAAIGNGPMAWDLSDAKNIRLN
jgi:hypothetical protein